MQMGEGGHEYIDAIAFEDEVIADEESDSAEGDNGEQLEASAEETRGER
jgi:hypothetical protein